MADINIAYGASVNLTITLASLPTDAALLTGRESTERDNTAANTNFLDYILSGKITVGTTPTAAKEIRVYVVGLMDDSTYPDVFDGTDSAETISNAGIRDSVCKLAAVMATLATSDLAYPFGGISVASLFGGVLPKKFVVFVTHSTAVNLNATAGNHQITLVPVYETIV